MGAAAWKGSHCGSGLLLIANGAQLDYRAAAVLLLTALIDGTVKRALLMTRLVRVNDVIWPAKCLWLFLSALSAAGS